MPDSAEEGREHTFVATDVVGSTALHRRFPNDMLAAMDLHDQILHSAIRSHHGNPFKNTGDGLFAVFDRAVDALRAVLDAQSEMRNAPWGPTGRLSFRVGVHTGLARPRGNDFFGPALSTVARLQGAANGDQLLVSMPTLARLSPAERSGFDVLDLGEHHFKGIDRLRVFQVCQTGMASSFPPIGGKRETASGNLPANLTSFLGRERELAELTQLACECRVLTLIGPGGIGKTRLAIELMRVLEPSFPDGAWMVDLASLERGADVWPAIASALLIEPLPGVERRVQVLEHLHHARAVVLMDNCEHVLDEIAEAVADLASGCGTVFTVNTSRHSLGLDGEALYGVTALASAPDASFAQSPAVRLFVARGRLSDHRFQPDAQELGAIHALCAKLEFIPLAIEIAAAHLRRLSVEQMAAAFENALDVRPAGSQRRIARHQTLRQALEWSYELLEPESRRILQRLSVFSGPFHEEQALALCADDFAEEDQVRDGMDELLDSSLLSRDSGGKRLFRMLQTVQAFGRERLNDAGLLDAAERRHGEVFLARCNELGRQLASEREAAAVHAIFDELPNLRAAFERAFTRDLALAAQLAASLFLFNYSQRGAETAAWYARIAAREGVSELDTAPVIFAGAAGHAFHSLGDVVAAERFIEQGLALERAGRGTSRGWLHGVAGQMAQWSRDHTRCLGHLSAAVEQARHAGNIACESTALCMAAYVRARSGDTAGAQAAVQEVTALGPSLTQPTLLGYLHYARGRIASFHDTAQAIDEYRISVHWANMAGNPLGALRVQHFIAELETATAEPAQALAIQITMLRAQPAHGTAYYAWSAIQSLLAPLHALGHDEEVSMLAGALQGAPVKPSKAARAALDAARHRLGPAAFNALMGKGARLSLAQARDYCESAMAALSAKENQ